MYRLADGEQRVLQLDAPEPEPSDSPDVAQQLSFSPPSAPAPQKPRSSSSKAPSKSTCSSSAPPTETDAPDVVLHAGGCAVAVHLSVLRLRCPWLYKQLRQLRHFPPSASGFSLRLMEHEELRTLVDKQEDACKCPLRDTQSLRLDYVRCVTHRQSKGRGGEDAGGRCSSLQDSPEIKQRRKRLRQDEAPGDENRPPQGQSAALVVPKSRRSLFSQEEALNAVALSMLEKQEGVMHVKVEGAHIGAVVTVVEYIYRFKVRVLDERDAFEAVRLGQWVGMRCTMLYYSLVLAIRHVTTKTWMEMLLAASKLDDKVMRRLLCERLLAYVKQLGPNHYYQMLTDMRCVYISRLKHHDILLRAVVGLINNVRLVEFWRNLLDALGKWLCYRFQTTHVPSLRAIHRHFAPEWKPYKEIARVEVQAKPGQGDLFTLLQFGKFQLQVRIDITDEMPIMYRIIRSSSPQLLSTEPDKLDGPAALDDDPQFCIRGQMKIKYWRAQPDRAEVAQEVVIEYQHNTTQYSRWWDLVPPSPSTLAPAMTNAAIQSEVMGKAQFRGKFFIWGDPVCSMYHFLLHTTLFYSAPHGASTELSDLMVVSEMQRLPLETLVLVLRSDRLRIPYGERTLLRCLNKLVFGNNFSYLGSSQQTPNDFNGRAKDVVRLYKCVRWCFIPLDDIIGTLRRSPRQLKFYEMIEKGLQDTFRRFLRRRPWGWRKYRHAYMKNETNVIEFRIEAGENELSPEYFAPVPKIDASSQDSLISK